MTGPPEKGAAQPLWACAFRFLRLAGARRPGELRQRPTVENGQRLEARQGSAPRATEARRQEHAHGAAEHATEKDDAQPGHETILLWPLEVEYAPALYRRRRWTRTIAVLPSVIRSRRDERSTRSTSITRRSPASVS